VPPSSYETVALGQIAERMGFDFIGRPSADNTTDRVSPFSMMLNIISFWTFLNLAIFGAFNYKWSRGMELSNADVVSLAGINIAMLAFTVYVTASTRGSIREKYLIRENRCLDLEDCFCATFCMPLTICQMARHTASFNDYDGVCCNKTGIPDDVNVDNGTYAQEVNRSSDSVQTRQFLV
jgi:Cys-rich protein (TIGR01571 family)